MQTLPLTIGLTGGIGSGKTTVANLFAKLNVTVIDADKLARDLVNSDPEVIKEIKNRWGNQFFDDQENLLRKTLRDFIFEHPKEKTWLEKLLHPRIRNTMSAEIKHCKTPYCILVIPLLIENLPHPLIDRILLVDTTEALQTERATRRDNTNPEKIKHIVAQQASRETRLAHADDTILNTHDPSTLKHAVEALHLRYLEIAKNVI